MAASLLELEVESTSPMPNYIPLDETARTLKTTVQQLREFERLGWISTVEKNGMSYMKGDQEYRAKYILALQRKGNLNAAQISTVLSAQRPPYCLNDVDRLLSEGENETRLEATHSFAG
jgi:hypothetical protein